MEQGQSATTTTRPTTTSEVTAVDVTPTAECTYTMPSSEGLITEHGYLWLAETGRYRFTHQTDKGNIEITSVAGVDAFGGWSERFLLSAGDIDYAEITEAGDFQITYSRPGVDFALKWEKVG